jgi:butyryl-CoA dehydrogenase
MAIKTFAAETMSYRVTGMIEEKLTGWSWAQPDAAAVKLKAVEEFAAECSYIKVFASEALDYVVDEGVQIHGGYGYHQDYLVERAYRDSRINRIFEGTNEINRMLATGMILKRAQRGQLPLVAAVKKLQGELLAGPSLAGGPPDLVKNAKKIALLCLGVAYQKYMTELDSQQEILAALCDISMQAFAMESVQLRSQKHSVAPKMTAVFLQEAMEEVERYARMVLAACAEGDDLRIQLAALKRLTKFEPVNTIALRQEIAQRLLTAQRYVLA